MRCRVGTVSSRLSIGDWCAAAGTLDLEEFKGALDLLGVVLSPAKTRKLFHYFDQDGSNSVDVRRSPTDHLIAARFALPSRGDTAALR